MFYFQTLVVNLSFHLPLVRFLCLNMSDYFVFQNRPSVITCAPANNRNCNLSHNGCSSLANNYRRINSESRHSRKTDTSYVSKF